MAKTKLSEAKLWSLIAIAQWGTVTDTDKIERFFKTALSIEQFKQLCHFVFNKKEELKQRFEKDWLGEPGIGVSDDGWDDLTAEVVGRGEKFYKNITARKLRKMADESDYTENFTYAFQKYMPVFTKATKPAKNYKVEHLEIAKIHADHIPDDVLDLLEGAEVLSDMGVVNPTLGAMIYEVSKLKEYAVRSKDNDINETTRIKVAELYGAIHNYKYLMVHNPVV